MAEPLPDDVRDALVKARELISDPARWTQGAFAVTKSGFRIGVKQDNACRFCALGAVRRFAPEGDFRPETALHDAAKSLGFGNAVRANDEEGHAAVLALFDRALGETV